MEHKFNFKFSEYKEDTFTLDLNEFLTPHFTVREMLHSATCDRIGMINRLDEPELIVGRLEPQQGFSRSLFDYLHFILQLSPL